MKIIFKIAILLLVLCTFSDSVSATISLFDNSRNTFSAELNDDQKEENEEKTEKESSEEEKGEEEELFKSKNTSEYASLDISMHFYNLGLILEPHNPVSIPLHPSNKKDTPPPKFVA